MDNILDTVEEACRSAASLYGAGSVERGQEGIRFQGEDGAVAWEAQARIIPRTAGDREGEEGRLRGSEIDDGRDERRGYVVRVEVTAAYDRSGEHMVDRYARNAVRPDAASVLDVLEHAHERIPRF